MNPTTTAIASQAAEHDIDFAARYRDPVSGFEGEPTGLYFFKHGCMRVALRGVNRHTGEPAEYTFDAPELVAVKDDRRVPAGPRTGGPHDLAPVPRPGP